MPCKFDCTYFVIDGVASKCRPSLDMHRTGCEGPAAAAQRNVAAAAHSAVSRGWIFGDDGILLDAELEIESTAVGCAVVIHSSGGASRGRPVHNPDYIPALETILNRLREADGGLDGLWVDSKAVAHLPIEEREIRPGGRSCPIPCEALGPGDAAAHEAIHLVRGLISAIKVEPTPKKEPVALVVEGLLAVLLSANSVLMPVVAGVGFEPTTFRL